MNYKAPVITVPNIKDKQLTSTIKDLEQKGYTVTQRKKVEQWNHKTESNEVTWTLKAKINTPPPRPNRILVDG